MHKIVLVALFACGYAEATGPDLTGRVVDWATGKPIAGATVTSGNEVIATAADGSFHVPGVSKVLVRATGYSRTEAAANSEIRLAPIRPKALYLSVYGVGSKALREPALQLMEQTELNAFVIDVKGDRGLVPYPTSVNLAVQSGANRVITVRNMTQLVTDLHGRGVYLIARIVVFKDDPLATARPDLAVKTCTGKLFRDREGLAWTDPGKHEVWDYNIDVAVEAARIGFDEIQFDYVRFPDAKGLEFCVANTEENRVGALKGFFTEARKRLAPFNVYLAADIFGYVCWNKNDTFIGQKIEDIAPLVDYLSPMLYPSGFQFGIPGFRNPVANPYEILRRSLDQALERTHLSDVHFRPWLQAFRDYAFDRRVFGGDAIRAQIKAAEDAGTAGWMLWNPHNVYSADGLSPRKNPLPANSSITR